MFSKKKGVSRRTFINTMAVTGVAAYAAPNVFAKNILPSAPFLNTHKTTTATHWGSVETIVRGGEFIRVKPFKDEYPIPMIRALADRVNAQNRVKYPMVYYPKLSRQFFLNSYSLFDLLFYAAF